MAWRNNPRQALIENAPIMEKIWRIAQFPVIVRRALFDARIGVCLQRQVTLPKDKATPVL